MIPILYAEGTENFRYGNPGSRTFFGGIGALVDCLSCEVQEVLNGIFEGTLTYPASGPLFKHLRPGAIVYVDHDATHLPQPFDIYAWEVDLSGIATVRFRHVSYRLSRQVVAPIIPDGSGKTAADQCIYNYINQIIYRVSALTSVLNYAPGPSFWAPSTSDGRVTMLDNSYKDHGFGYVCRTLRTSRDALLGEEHSVLANEHCEFKFDHFAVYACARRGIDQPILLRYGANISGMTFEYDQGENVPNIIPYWTDSETGRTVYLDGDSIFDDFSHDSRTVGVPEDKLLGETFNAMPVDVSSFLDEEPTDTQLYDVAYEYYYAQNLGRPYVNMTFNIELTEDESNQEMQQILLGDTCGMFFPEVGVTQPLELTAVTYDALAERYTSLSFGSAARTIYNVSSGGGTQETEGAQTIVIDGDIIEVDPTVADEGGEDVPVEDV